MAQPRPKVLVEDRSYGQERVDQVFTRERYEEAGISGDSTRKARVEKPAADDNRPTQNVANMQREERGRQQEIDRRQKLSKKVTKKNKKQKLAKKLLQKSGLGFMVDKGLFFVNMFVWGWFQIPFAVFNIVMFGFLYVYLELVGSIRSHEVKEGDSIIEQVSYAFIGFARFVANSVNDAIRHVTGYDLGEALMSVVQLPMKLYMFFELTLIAYTIMLMLVVGLVYAAEGVNPFGGKRTPLKVSLIVFTVAGMTLPFTNLIPWIVIWAWLAKKADK